MKHSVLVAVTVCLAAFDAPPAAAAREAPTTATRLSSAHARLAGAARERIESYGARLRGRTKEAYGALVRGVFEYTLRLDRLIAKVDGLRVGLRSALRATARASLVSPIVRGKVLGRGFVEAVRERWQRFLAGARAVFDGAGAPMLSRTLENRLHALAMNAQTIFYGAVHSAKGTVTALMSGFEANLEPALRAAAALIREDAENARRRFEAAYALPNM